MSVLKKEQAYKQGDWKNALINTFESIDLQMNKKKANRELWELNWMKDKEGAELKDGEYPQTSGGTCANVCIITKDEVYCANAGDSRTVVCKEGKAVALSVDDKPE